MKMEKNNIKLDVEKIEKLEKLQDNYYKEYENNLQIHDKYINEMKRTYNKKADFDL